MASTSTTAPIPDASDDLLGISSQRSQEQQQEQDEGVLADVLEELDRERSKRAELQAQVRQLQTQLTQAQQAKKQPDRAAVEQKEVSRQAFISMETQVQGFQELVDALTLGKPAIRNAAAAEAQASSKSKRKAAGDAIIQKTLPLHVVRLLEVLPWDPRAREHIFGLEELYEWQIYDAREQGWQSQLRYFPKLFKSQPIVQPRAASDTVKEEPSRERNLLVFLAGAAGDKAPAAPSKHGVLTNANLTQLYNIEAGFPLPQDGGTWQWIGGWRIDKRPAVDPAAAAITDVDGTPLATEPPVRHKVDCDDKGWSYAAEAQHFIVNPTEWVWDNPGNPTITTTDNKTAAPPQRKVRRRKWTRQRVLVDYPFCSERTKNYLRLLADNARLAVTSNKVSEQLVQTKMLLTEAEEVLMQTKETLQEDIRRKDKLLKDAGIKDEFARSRTDSEGNLLQEFLANKNEQVKEVIGSKISQWVTQSTARRSGENLDGDGGSGDLTSSVSATQNGDDGSKVDLSPKLAWKKLGRGALFDKFTAKQAPSAPSLSNTQSGGSASGGTSHKPPKQAAHKSSAASARTTDTGGETTDTATKEATS